MWIPEKCFDYVSKQKHDDISMLHYYYNTIMNLKDHMNTLAAREMAEVRHQFTNQFFIEFFEEWPEDVPEEPTPTPTQSTAAAPAAAPSKKFEPIGKVTITALNVSKNLLEGTGDEMHHGIGHLTGTPMPGAFGNCVISAHRVSSSGMEPFRYMDLLENGDIVTIEYDGAVYNYEIFDMFIVSKEDVWVLQPDWSVLKMLTLITCDPLIYPGGNRPDRLIARARLVTD